MYPAIVTLKTGRPARLVYRVAWAILRNHHDAEDVTQEVFLRVLRLRRELEGVRDPKTWLARIAYRVALDRRPRAVQVSLDDEVETVRTQALRDALRGLTRQQRRAVDSGVERRGQSSGSDVVGQVVEPLAQTLAVGVGIELEVTGELLEDRGDADPHRMSRLRWLDSRLAQDDGVVPPYTPLTVEKFTVSCLGRSLAIGRDCTARHLKAVAQSSAGCANQAE